MEIKIKRYDDGLKNIWDDFLKIAKNSIFMFYRSYMDYHRDRFFDHSLLFYQGKELIAVFPANEKDGKLISHGGLTYGGFVTTNDMRQIVMNECFVALIDYCQKNNLKEVLYKSLPSIYHLQPAEEDSFSLYYYGAVVDKIEASTIIDLQSPIKMSKLRRRQINKSQKNNVYIEIDNSIITYRKFMEMQDAILFEKHQVNAVHTGDEIYLLHSRFPNNIHLYAAKKDGELLGGSIVFIYDNVVHTQYLCANNEARCIGALDATIARIINDYAMSRKWLDFGISTEKKGRYLNEGLINQKEGFGGRTMVYTTWILSIDTR